MTASSATDVVVDLAHEPADSRNSTKADSDPLANSAMKRRDAFVVEVANTIRTRHASENESFVFGLSGR